MPDQPSMWSKIVATVKPASWEELLHDLNKTVLSNDQIVADLPADLVESGWLGLPEAQVNIIEAAEARLGRPLSPSYRAFLAASNGWQCFDWTRMALLPAEQINWLREVDPNLVEIWEDLEKSSWGLPPSDADYAASYQEGQEIDRFRPEHVRDMLALSDRGMTNADYIWLNPHAIFPDGEWEAWTFMTGEGQGTCYRSFWELMVDQLRRQVHDRLFP